MSDEKRIDRIERLVERNADAIADLKDSVTEVTISVGKLEGTVVRLEQKMDSNNERLDLKFAKLEKELSWKMIAGSVAGGMVAGLFTMATLFLRSGTGF